MLIFRALFIRHCLVLSFVLFVFVGAYSEEMKYTDNTKKMTDIVILDTHEELKNALNPLQLFPVQDYGIKSDARYIPRYKAGDGSIGLGAGVNFPLFFQKYTGEISSANLSIGGDVWFEWDIFLWKGLSTGMEIGGMFALTPNSRTLFMAPITGHLKYTFQLYPVEFPITLAAGFNLSSLESDFKADFITKPKAGITYRINQNWTLGLYSSYWFIVQDYSLTLGEDYSRLGNFIDTTAGFSYVF